MRFDDIKYSVSYLRDDGRQGAYLNDGQDVKRDNIAYEGVSVLTKHWQQSKIKNAAFHLVLKCQYQRETTNPMAYHKL